MKTVSIILALMVAALFGVSSAAAEGYPSSKATFAYDELVALETGCDNTEGCPADSGWTTILKAKIKMANQKDLFIDASLQCGIVTDTTVKSLSGVLSKGTARGTVTVLVKLTDPDGNVSYAKPSDGIDATGIGSFSVGEQGVVFCDRIQELGAKFAGLNCIANQDTHVVTCTDPEELQLILKTLNANSFNFVAANLSSGVYTIEVLARTSANVTVEGGALGAANAFIGAGSVAVESVRMIKGNDGTTLELQ